MRHVPVLINEVIESLQLKPGKHIIDCTLGDAGHSERILQEIGSKGTLLGIDADPESLMRAKKFLHQYEEQVILVRDNFVRLKEIVKEEKFGPVNGILMDYGWSSPQFEERGRGFTFLKDEPLDMRYGGKGTTAAELINSSEPEELGKIFKEYGEEKLSKEVVHKIIAYRKEKTIERTGELVELVLQAYREKLKTDKKIPWIGGLHPATKVFQAIRIAVNDELGVIEKVLPQAIDVLQPGGRLAVITFHSLEDRIVKHYFKERVSKDITIISKKPIVASKEEFDSNPRARSAKLRVVEKK